MRFPHGLPLFLACVVQQATRRLAKAEIGVRLPARAPPVHGVTAAQRPFKPSCQGANPCGPTNFSDGEEASESGRLQPGVLSGAIPLPSSIYSRFIGVVAQSAERLPCMQQVAGAIPADSTFPGLVDSNRSYAREVFSDTCLSSTQG